MSETLGYIPETEQSNIGEVEKSNIGEELTELLESFNDNSLELKEVESNILRLSTKLSWAKDAHSREKLSVDEYNSYITQTINTLKKYIETHPAPETRQTIIKAVIKGFDISFPQIIEEIRR